MMQYEFITMNYITWKYRNPDKYFRDTFQSSRQPLFVFIAFNERTETVNLIKSYVLSICHTNMFLSSVMITMNDQNFFIHSHNYFF